MQSPIAAVDGCPPRTTSDRSVDGLDDRGRSVTAIGRESIHLERRNGGTGARR